MFIQSRREIYFTYFYQRNILWLLICFITLSSYNGFAQTEVYFTDVCTGILKLNPENNSLDTLISLTIRENIALDLQQGKMYWTEWGANKIQRANLDGSQIEDLVTSNLLEPDGIALDLVNKKIYWTDWGKKKIQRSNLDGSSVENIKTTGLSYPKGIALDVSNQKIYWTDSGTKKIMRSNLNGSQVQELVKTGLKEPDGIAIDTLTGKIYWTDWVSKKIQRANLDGTQVEDIIKEGLNQPNGITLDLIAGKVYWTDRVSGKIQRANLDGTQVEDVVSGILSYPEGIALDLESGHLYWTDNATNKLQRSDLNGNQVEDLLYQGTVEPVGITLHLEACKMYWTDRITRKIQRANLDGSQLEDLISSGIGNPAGIALDVQAEKIYWTDRRKGKIQRANLDGSQIEDLVYTGLADPNSIALDLKNQKMYWTDGLGKKIQRANLDGSGIENILTTGLNKPYGIALDLNSAKMYWVDQGAIKIQRANLDGSEIENLISNLLVEPSAIILDTLEQKMYWSDKGKERIQRANLDGTQIEDVLTKTVTCLKVGGIALLSNIPDKPEPSLQGEQHVCLGTELAYTTPMRNYHSFRWKVEKGIILGKEDSSSIRIQWIEPGQGKIQVIETNCAGLADSVSMEVTVYPQPQPRIMGNLGACLESKEIYACELSSPANLLNWEVKGGSILSGQGTSRIEVHWYEGSSAQVSLQEIQPMANCENSTEISFDLIDPQLEIFSEDAISELCEGESLRLLLRTNLDIKNYSWYREGVATPISDGSFLWVNQPGLYWVEALTNCGTIRSQTFQLGSSVLFVPNLFSPNGDGHNDRFTVCSDDPRHIQEIELVIYDKYGTMLYQSDQPQDILCQQQIAEKGWDGGNYPSDTYLWILKVKLERCGEKQQKGFVKLIR